MLNFAVHHLAPYSMTAMLLPLVERAGGRIINTSSEGHRAALFHRGDIDIDFDDLQSDRGYDTFLAYSRTKLANLLFTYEYHRRLPETPIAAVDPGMVRRRLARSLRNPGFRVLSTSTRMLLTSPRERARPVAHLATSRDTPTASSAQSMNEHTAARLWAITERLHGPVHAEQRAG